MVRAIRSEFKNMRFAARMKATECGARRRLRLRRNGNCASVALGGLHTAGEKLLRAAIAMLLLLGGQAFGQDRQITVANSTELVESGFAKYLYPRFSLKKGIRINAVALHGGVEADLLIGPDYMVKDGIPVFKGGDSVYMAYAVPSSEKAELVNSFLDWLVSEIGKRTIDSFAPDGVQLYESGPATEVKAVAREFSGDAVIGAKFALALCGRCHVVGEVNRKKGLGSTPSFGALRAMGDWENRFFMFYLLNPHPAFTQIEDVTDPFDETRPSPIAPLELTLEILDSIIAYVNEMEPADLGGEIQFQ